MRKSYIKRSARNIASAGILPVVLRIFVVQLSPDVLGKIDAAHLLADTQTIRFQKEWMIKRTVPESTEEMFF